MGYAFFGLSSVFSFDVIWETGLEMLNAHHGGEAALGVLVDQFYEPDDRHAFLGFIIKTVDESS